MTETKIYIGLNDSGSLKQEHDTAEYISVLKNVCISYHVPFSFSVAEGGYMHEDSRYTQENTLILSLMDVPPETINEIAKDLCAFFNQESVMITEGNVKVYFINESLQPQEE